MKKAQVEKLLDVIAEIWHKSAKPDSWGVNVIYLETLLPKLAKRFKNIKKL